MTTALEIAFARLDAPHAATTVAFAAKDAVLSPAVQSLNTKSGGQVVKAVEAASFKGKAKSAIEILAPQKLDIQRLILVGAGKTADNTESDWAQIGGYALGQVSGRKTQEASLIAEVAGADAKPEVLAANLAFGALLRHYTFSKYLTKKNGGEEGAANGNNAEAKPDNDRLTKLTVHCADPDKARAAFEAKRALAAGIHVARDLVNEPANVLGPVEFADRVKELEKIGLEVEIFAERRDRFRRNRAIAEVTAVVVDGEKTTAAQALSRPPVTIDELIAQGFAVETDSRRAHIDVATLTAELKYGGYLKRHEAQWSRTRAQELRAIPRDFKYQGLPGLSREVQVALAG